MNYYRLLLLVLLLLSFLSNNYAQHVNISGKHFEGKSIFIHLDDELMNSFTREMEYDTTSKRNKSVNISISRPQFIYLFDVFKNKKVGYYPMLVFPGDSIQVYCDETHCWFEGKYKNEYLFRNLMSSKEAYSENLEIKCQECPEKYNEYKTERIAYINKMSDSLNFRKEFKNYLEKSVEFMHLWGWLQAYNPDAKLKPKNSVTKNYLDSLHSLKSIFQIDSISIHSQYYSVYSNYLKFYNIFLAENDYFKNPSIDKLFESAIKNFNGIQRDLLLTLLILDEINANEINPTHISLFNQYCLTPKYHNFINYKISKKSVNINPNDLLNISILKPDNKRLLLDELIDNDKIYYIDFWASWCLPCLKEIPESKKLQKEFENKGINFLYISTDKNEKAWRKALRETGLSVSNNYLLSEDTQLEKIKVTSIPRYIILGKSGKIINYDAPYPSDPKTKVIFNELLIK